MNYCSCSRCNGIYPDVEFPPKQTQEVEEVEAPKSVYERLSDLHTKLCLLLETEDAGLLDELLSITEEVDRIDDGLNDLQKKAGGLSGDEIQFEISQASQRLY